MWSLRPVDLALSTVEITSTIFASRGVFDTSDAFCYMASAYEHEKVRKVRWSVCSNSTLGSGDGVARACSMRHVPEE